MLRVVQICWMIIFLDCSSLFANKTLKDAGYKSRLFILFLSKHLTLDDCYMKGTMYLSWTQLIWLKSDPFKQDYINSIVTYFLLYSYINFINNSAYFIYNCKLRKEITSQITVMNLSWNNSRTLKVFLILCFLLDFMKTINLICICIWLNTWNKSFFFFFLTGILGLESSCWKHIA